MAYFYGGVNMVTFQVLWKNKYLTANATTVADMAKSLQEAADELKAMHEAGVGLENDGCVADDYAHLSTTDVGVAEQFGMYEAVTVSLNEGEGPKANQIEEFAQAQGVDFESEAEDIYPLVFPDSWNRQQIAQFIGELQAQFPWVFCSSAVA
jgi:hypothetical protein